MELDEAVFGGRTSGVGGAAGAALDEALEDEPIEGGGELGLWWVAGGEEEAGAAEPAIVGDGFGEGAEQSLLQRGRGDGDVSGVPEQANEAMDVGAEELADADGVGQGFGREEGRRIGGMPDEVEDEGDARDVGGEFLVVPLELIGAAWVRSTF